MTFYVVTSAKGVSILFASRATEADRMVALRQLRDELNQRDLDVEPVVGEDGQAALPTGGET